MSPFSYLVSANIKGRYSSRFGGMGAPSLGSQGRAFFEELAALPLDPLKNGFLAVVQVGNQMMVCRSQPHRLTAAPSNFTQAFFGPPEDTLALLARPAFLEQELEDLPLQPPQTFDCPAPPDQDGPLTPSVLAGLVDQVCTRAKTKVRDPLYFQIPDAEEDDAAFVRAVALQVYQEIFRRHGKDALRHMPVALSSRRVDFAPNPIQLVFVTPEEAKRLPRCMLPDGAFRGCVPPPPPSGPSQAAHSPYELLVLTPLDTLLQARELPKGTQVRLSGTGSCSVVLSRGKLIELCTFVLEPNTTPPPEVEESVLLFAAGEGFFTPRHLPDLLNLPLSEATRKAIYLAAMSQVPAADTLALLKAHPQWHKELALQLQTKPQTIPLLKALSPSVRIKRHSRPSRIGMAALAAVALLLTAVCLDSFLTVSALYSQTEQLAAIAAQLGDLMVLKGGLA